MLPGLLSCFYDHRSFGLSGGEPRQHINPWVQLRGYRDAITFTETYPGSMQPKSPFGATVILPDKSLPSRADVAFRRVWRLAAWRMGAGDGTSGRHGMGDADDCGRDVPHTVALHRTPAARAAPCRHASVVGDWRDGAGGPRLAWPDTPDAGCTNHGRCWRAVPGCRNANLCIASRPVACRRAR